MKYKYYTIRKLNKLSRPIKILVIIKIWFHIIYNITSLPKINIQESFFGSFDVIFKNRWIWRVLTLSGSAFHGHAIADLWTNDLRPKSVLGLVSTTFKDFLSPSNSNTPKYLQTSPFSRFLISLPSGNLIPSVATTSPLSDCKPQGTFRYTTINPYICAEDTHGVNQGF